MIFCANTTAQFQSYQSEIEEAILAVARGNSYVLELSINDAKKIVNVLKKIFESRFDYDKN